MVSKIFSRGKYFTVFDFSRINYHDLPSSYSLHLRPGKLNLQFIVTTRMDFPQKISDFRLYTATVWHFGPAPSSAAIEGHGLGDHEFEPSISHTLLLV